MALSCTSLSIGLLLGMPGVHCRKIADYPGILEEVKAFRITDWPLFAKCGECIWIGQAGIARARELTIAAFPHCTCRLASASTPVQCTCCHSSAFLAVACLRRRL